MGNSSFFFENFVPRGTIQCENSYDAMAPHKWLIFVAKVLGKLCRTLDFAWDFFFPYPSFAK